MVSSLSDPRWFWRGVEIAKIYFLWDFALGVGIMRYRSHRDIPDYMGVLVAPATFILLVLLRRWHDIVVLDLLGSDLDSSPCLSCVGSEFFILIMGWEQMLQRHGRVALLACGERRVFHSFYNMEGNKRNCTVGKGGTGDLHFSHNASGTNWAKQRWSFVHLKTPCDYTS